MDAEQIKNSLFEQLSKTPLFKNLSMDMQGELINNFVQVVLLLQIPEDKEIL